MMTDEDYLHRDLVERKARRERGDEPPTWQLPPREPEPVKAASPNLLKLVTEINNHTERRLEELAGLIGEETARNEKELRDEFKRDLDRTTWGLHSEFKNHLGRSVAEKSLQQREAREAANVEMKNEMLNLRRELLELREQLAEMRVSRSKALNGGGLHADH
jgi:hypothetical protein